MTSDSFCFECKLVLSIKHNNPQGKPVVFESRMPWAADRSGFPAKPAGPQFRRPVSTKHNDPQGKPVVFESRMPWAADGSGFPAKPCRVAPYQPIGRLHLTLCALGGMIPQLTRRCFTDEAMPSLSPLG